MWNAWHIAIVRRSSVHPCSRRCSLRVILLEVKLVLMKGDLVRLRRLRRYGSRAVLKIVLGRRHRLLLYRWSGGRLAKPLRRLLGLLRWLGTGITGWPRWVPKSVSLESNLCRTRSSCHKINSSRAAVNGRPWRIGYNRKLGLKWHITLLRDRCGWRRLRWSFIALGRRRAFVGCFTLEESAYKATTKDRNDDQGIPDRQWHQNACLCMN